MKRLQRAAAPSRIDRDDDEARERLRQWYDEAPRDHWNDEVRGTQPVRETELARGLAMDRVSDATIQTYVGLHGRETTFRALLAYWRSFLPPTTSPGADARRV